jgi:hypothetical protein
MFKDHIHYYGPKILVKSRIQLSDDKRTLEELILCVKKSSPLYGHSVTVHSSRSLPKLRRPSWPDRQVCQRLLMHETNQSPLIQSKTPERR